MQSMKFGISGGKSLKRLPSFTWNGIVIQKRKRGSAVEDKNQQMAHRVAEAVAQAGGRVYYVGGFVRDRLRGKESKDVDIEVHGVPAPLLEKILDGLGERTAMGASFGIYGLKHYEIDIAMPRREHATGRGHRDFEIFTDPFLGPEKAALRRDFTVNAMMEDVLTGEIVDYFGGQEDLKRGIIRHVSDASFVEDPLRVLRAAQFAARFGFRVAGETVALCRTMDVAALASERVMGELEKALLKAKKPSVFFDTLRSMEQLGDWFPEVQALIGIPQEPRFHPEGDVWNHTMLVLDQAALLRENAREPLGFLLAALCHDFGKRDAIQDDGGRIRALGHEEAGIPIADAFLSRITAEKKLHAYVCSMVRLHMRPNILAAQHPGKKSFYRLFDESVCPEDLLLLAKADALGCGTEKNYETAEQTLRQMLSAYDDVMSRPFVQGADLVAAGFRPGKDFGEALAYAHKLRLAEVPKEEALRQTAGFLRRARQQGK